MRIPTAKKSVLIGSSQHNLHNNVSLNTKTQENSKSISLIQYEPTTCYKKSWLEV